MQDFSIGGGLAALAFWGFITTVIVSGMWYDIRRKEAQQETIRRLFESGQTVDEAVLDKLLTVGGGTDRLDRSLQIAGLILLPAAVGLALLGFILGTQFPESRLPVLGAAALVGCVGFGVLLAARIARRWYASNGPATGN
jgi:hypothetical protein